MSQETITEEQASPYLWGVAVEALDCLHHAAQTEQEQARQALKQCIETRGVSAGIAIPANPHEAKCLVKLMLLVHSPPMAL